MLKQADYDERYFNAGGDHGGYDDYASTAAPRAAEFAKKLEDTFGDLNGQRILDVGCGFGFLVRDLRARGASAVGIDWSRHAVTEGRRIGEVICGGEADSEASFFLAKQRVGMLPLDEFDLVVDQELVPCLADVAAMDYFALAKKHGAIVVHCFENSPGMARWYNIKPLAAWRTLAGASPREHWLVKESA